MRKLFEDLGNLPNICPHCDTKDRWEYGDMEYATDTCWQIVICLECETVFHEIYELTKWEKIKVND